MTVDPVADPVPVSLEFDLEAEQVDPDSEPVDPEPVYPEPVGLISRVSPERETRVSDLVEWSTRLGHQLAMDYRGTQTRPPMQSMSTSVVTTEAVENTLQKVDDVAQELGIPLNFRTVIPDFVNSCHVSLQYYGDPPPEVHNSNSSWSRHYCVLSFLLNGHLFADYDRLSGMLGLPPCSHQTWHLIVERLEKHVTQVAEWSCSHVRDTIKSHGDHKQWIASFDGFYLTRGHYSNNSSATLHDLQEWNNCMVLPQD